MVSQSVVVKNPTGLHLRPAGNLCKEAIQFKSLITFSFRDTTANAKSVLSVLGACVKLRRRRRTGSVKASCGSNREWIG